MRSHIGQRRRQRWPDDTHQATTMHSSQMRYILARNGHILTRKERRKPFRGTATAISIVREVQKGYRNEVQYSKQVHITQQASPVTVTSSATRRDGTTDLEPRRRTKAKSKFINRHAAYLVAAAHQALLFLFIAGHKGPRRIRTASFQSSGSDCYWETGADAT